MTDAGTSGRPQGQLYNCKEAARQLGTDDDPKRFKERLGKLVKPKPMEIRDAGGLEAAADAMGARAARHKPMEKPE